MPDYEQTLAYQLLQRFESYKSEIERLSFVVKMCPIPVLIAGADGTPLNVNPAYRKTFGRGIDGLQGNDWLTIYHPDDRLQLAQFWQNFIATKQSSTTDARYLCPDTGEAKRVRITCVPVPDDGIIAFLLPESCWKLVPPAGIPPAT